MKHAPHHLANSKNPDGTKRHLDRVVQAANQAGNPAAAAAASDFAGME